MGVSWLYIYGVLGINNRQLHFFNGEFKLIPVLP